MPLNRWLDLSFDQGAAFWHAFGLGDGERGAVVSKVIDRDRGGEHQLDGRRKPTAATLAPTRNVAMRSIDQTRPAVALLANEIGAVRVRSGQGAR